MKKKGQILRRNGIVMLSVMALSVGNVYAGFMFRKYAGQAGESNG